MTFTVIGRDEKSGQLGIAICTNPITVGNRCPFILANVGAVSTQAASDPGLGPLALQLLKLGYSPEKVIRELADSDEGYAHRQIGIVDRHGRSAVYTGEETISSKGAISGLNYIVMGNYLKNDRVVEAMNEGWLTSDGKMLEDRLFCSLQAGRGAGGDSGGHRSAGLLVYSTESYPRTDLRIDFVPKTDDGPDAVDSLEILLEKWRPLIPYYVTRPHKPEMPNWRDWLNDRGTPFVE